MVQHPVKVLDVRGLLCPYPVLKAEEAIMELKSGEILEIRTTDSGTIMDIPAWAEKKGHQILETSDQWLEIVFLVIKG